MNIQIRECRIEDAPSIQMLNDKEMGYDYPVEQTKKQLQHLIANDHDKIFVASVNGDVVGYVHAADYDVIYAPHMKNIMGIAVSGNYKNRGIGRKLLEAVEEWAKQTGAEGVRLVSGAGRTGAHEFYRRCGYAGEKQQINFKKYFT